MNRKPIQSHRELEVYKIALETAMQIFSLTKKFPQDERYSLTDQIHRSSRSICANLAEAWRKRRYEGAFINKLSDAEAEAAGTQVWLEFAVKCEYLDATVARDLYHDYDRLRQVGEHDQPSIALVAANTWKRENQGLDACSPLPLRFPAPLLISNV